MDKIKKYNTHSIRDIAIAKSAPKTVVKRKKGDTSKTPINTGYKKQIFSLKHILLSIFVLVLVFFSTYFLLKDDTVKIIISETGNKEVFLSDDLVHIAYKEPEDMQLGYSIRQFTKTKSKSIKAETKKYVEQKAHGTLVVYNEFSTAPQRIITNTRFESPDGKIYRVRKPFVIPGMKKSGGKNIPGQVEIKVYAEESGSDYNLEKGAHLTLPGLKSDSKRYSKIYAISKTGIKGGFKGEKVAVSDDQKEKVFEELKGELATDIFNDVVNGLAKDEITFKDLVFINYNDLEDKSSGDTVTLSLSADARVLIMNKFDFAKEVVLSSDAGLFEDDAVIYIDNPQNIAFVLLNKDDIDPENSDVIKFTTKGKIKVKYYLDEDALKEDIKGRNISILNMIKDSYPALRHSTVKVNTVRWFGPSRFPEDTQKILIMYENN